MDKDEYISAYYTRNQSNQLSNRFFQKNRCKARYLLTKHFVIIFVRKPLGGSNLDIIMLGTLTILVAAMYGIIRWSSHVVDDREEK